MFREASHPDHDHLFSQNPTPEPLKYREFLRQEFWKENVPGLEVPWERPFRVTNGGKGPVCGRTHVDQREAGQHSARGAGQLPGKLHGGYPIRSDRRKPPPFKTAGTPGEGSRSRMDGYKLKKKPAGIPAHAPQEELGAYPPRRTGL
jgi:hypothetical protein